MSGGRSGEAEDNTTRSRHSRTLPARLSRLYCYIYMLYLRCDLSELRTNTIGLLESSLLFMPVLLITYCSISQISLILSGPLPLVIYILHRLLQGSKTTSVPVYVLLANKHKLFQDEGETGVPTVSLQAAR